MIAATSARLRGLRDQAFERLDALPGRDRALVAGLLLALPILVEWVWVWPLHDRRTSIADAVVASRQEVDAARLAASQDALQAVAGLERSLQDLDTELARHGSTSRGSEPLSRVFERLLSPQPVHIVALRELPSQDVVAPSAAGPAATALAAVTGAAADGAPGSADPAAMVAAAAPAVVLVRHRVELELSGEPGHLVAALRALEQGARPLRVERVRLHAVDDRATVHLGIVFTAVTADRSWLTL